MAGLVDPAATIGGPGDGRPALLATTDHCKFCFDVLLAKLQRKPLPEPSFANKHLQAPLFVTWTKLNGDLRGCIGNFSDLELGKGISEYALIAALEDHRFDPIRLSEVPGLSVGVSLLVNFENADHARDWEVGKHGIRISFRNPEDGRNCNATFLPEVAKEQHWTIDETLAALVRKAGCRLPLTEGLVQSIKLVRYQSSKAHLAYPEFLTYQNSATSS